MHPILRIFLLESEPYKNFAEDSTIKWHRSHLSGHEQIRTVVDMEDSIFLCQDYGLDANPSAFYHVNIIMNNLP